MTVSVHNNVFVDADQPFRLVPCSVDHEGLMVHSFHIQGYSRLTIFAMKDHPEAHRLPAAVAAFNAVMDGEREVKP